MAEIEQPWLDRLPFDLDEALAAANLPARPYSENPGHWCNAAVRAEYLPVAYSRAMIDYQLAYWRGSGQPLFDLSLVLYQDKHPCGIWPLSFVAADGVRLGSNGDALLPPLFVAGLTPNVRKKLLQSCLDFVDTLARKFDIGQWQSLAAFENQSSVSEWQHLALCRGATVTCSYELFIDLHRSVAEIKSGFRKSYRPLVSLGAKLWQIAVLDGRDDRVWDEFKNLHREVAGRVTRSDDSWRLQHAAVASGDAFLVYLRDGAQRMVGGGFFQVTRDEAVYAVAAYDRALFDKPLGHAVQYRAIEEMKSRGVRWYKIGARPYPGDQPPPSEKELRIAEFKQGFASHIFPCYRLTASLCH
ncbi:FemAB family protein [Methylomonas sp. HW2-6]|uniref:FemAB family protein n=1 Tax=Methylomonas sp. HW2-6 TaxID=3376687 RepID=UPI004042ECBC